MNRHISNSFRNLCPVKCQYDGFLFVFQFGWFGMPFFPECQEWLGRRFWECFTTSSHAMHPKIPIFNSCLTPSNLHFCALRKRKLKKMECKKFLSFSHLPRDHHVQVQGHHEVLLHLHSYKSWSSSLFKKFYLFFEVSYGLFSNCFDLVLTPNGEPCFEYFMAKNLKESKNIPFFPK